ncbi:tetratricopeptide repeat protein [Faecalimonas sp.]
MIIGSPMINLSPTQKQEAEQLFSRALLCAKNNDFTGAAKYYQQSANMGHPGAQNNLGNQYKNGRGVNRDPQEAVRLFTLSAKQGNVFGIRNLASCYLNGVGTDADFDLAVEWLETATEQKDHLACAMLAKAYDNWQHKDEEKKIFWHKKAAEYGNSESMFFLGEYYGKKGDNQNLSLASDYYDNAAKNGTPEMKLKVAKAFDMPSSGNEQAISLDKAKYWYNEILTCDNDNIVLDAAKGLDEMTEWGGRIRRPALDINKAYMAYRILAMKGNKAACSLAAYCSEVGKGTTPNIDIAIIFYEKAREFDKVTWCKKKKNGNLADCIYEENVENEMPIKIVDPYSHGKEYYRDNIDFNIAEYNGSFYFIKCIYEVGIYLCSSDDEGNNIKIVSQIPDEYVYPDIHVNCTGIYVYYTKDNDTLLVLYLDFDGKQLAECKEEFEGGYEDGYSISNIYIYGNDLFYVYEHNCHEENECCIKCMHVDTGIIERVYDRANSVDRLYATDGYIIFHARYENDECEQSWDDGWMIMNTLTNEVECISNPYCSPENVIDHPSYYNSESCDYNDKYDFNRRIVYFDLSRKIFWVERLVLEGEDSAHLHQVKYWEPKNLWGNRDELVAGMPVWRIAKNSTYSRREYFDGTIHYWDEGYFVFKSSSKYGEIYNWSEGNGGHGVCDEFKIVGGYMFLNIAAYDEEQYPLTVGVSSAIRKSWFDNKLPRNVIEEFVNTKILDTNDKCSDKPVIESQSVVNKRETDNALLVEFTEKEEIIEVKTETKPSMMYSTIGSDLKLCDFRINAERFVGVRDELLSFRKSLDEKWDYNAFVGILLSVKGPRYGNVVCSNFAIGQGDNFNSTKTRLQLLGLMSVYEKYKGKKYNHEITIHEVENEIVEIAPSLRGIREFFDKTVLEKMCDGSFDMISDDYKIVSTEKKDNRGEAMRQDLFVVKIIGDTDVKYNICTFGAKFHIGFGVPITIKINGNVYSFKMHNTVKGRIDGMKKLFTENNIELGTVLNASYDAENHELNLAIQ